MTTPSILTAAAERAQLTLIKPEPHQEKLVRNAMGYLIARSPFFAHLLYNEMHIGYVDNPSIPWFATDSYSIFVNARGIAGWSIGKVAFGLAHEVAHRVFEDLVMMTFYKASGKVFHPDGRDLPYVSEIMNIAEDLRINAMLVHAGIGDKPENICYDKSISEKGMESATEIYFKIFSQCQQGGGSGGDKFGKGMDVHLEPGKEQVAHAEAGGTKQAVAAAAQAAQASGQGQLPDAIKRVVGDILDPKVEWQDRLRATMQRKAGDPSYDWRYLDKRLMVRKPTPMYFARQSHLGAGTIVIGGDTSGSISDSMIDRFFAEMTGIVEDLNPAELIIIWCDAKVGRVDHLEEPEDLLELHADLQVNGANGGGGTSFIPVFKYIEENGIEPDMLVYLTDTHGSFPAHEPDYPVVWASIVPSPSVPWGDVVEVDL